MPMGLLSTCLKIGRKEYHKINTIRMSKMNIANKIYWKINKTINKHVKLEYIRWIFDNIGVLLSRDYYVLIGTPLHGNLGDQAIALAEYQFLYKCNKNKGILEIPSKYVSKIDAFRIWIGKRDILVHGGGFIGTLWIEEEYMLRNVISNFHDNKIIILPQTITFSKDETGSKELQISKKIYNAHSNLVICTREEKSYEFAIENFKKDEVIKIPDMVLQMRCEDNNIPKRAGVLLCLRSDHEKNLSEDDTDVIRSVCMKIFNGNVKYTDTNDAAYVTKDLRKAAVNKKLNEFRHAELIITDRLHGMVFAALAGTPCVALGNSNGKVKGIYNWIRKLDYIKYVESVDEFEDAVKTVLDVDNREYQYRYVEKEYMPLADLLKA